MTDKSELRFQEIYEEYRAKVFRYLVRMVGECEAEDLTQEVFVKVGRGLDAFRGESSLSTWIYRIANNAALDRLRSSQNDPQKRLPLEDFAEIECDEEIRTDERQHSAEKKVLRREMNGCIREIIDKLPDSYRSVIVLSELEGFKDGEIADIIGLSLQATKIRIHRARAKLRDELSKACDFFRDEENEFACERKEASTT
jgi:RNA polymerase sigma-70 factor (ECF subfamily)